MPERDLTQWLLDNGGPAIRYRTAAELLDDTGGIDVAQLRSDLIVSPMTQMWLDRIGNPSDMWSFHGSQPTAFENPCYKLCDLGLKAGMSIFDDRTARFRQFVAENESFSTRFIVVACLVCAGYGTEPAIQDAFLQRLDNLYALAKTGNYDIYIDQDTFGDYPAAFRKRPFVDPQFNDMLPSIHDVYAMAHYPKDAIVEATQDKIDTIVAYVLHPDYQALDDGYGIMRAGPRRYYSIGWSAHLPGYTGIEAMSDGRAKSFVQRLELMAHFPAAHNHRWFQESLAHLEGFFTKDGMYRFPARYLKELSAGYWVTGAYMRLEENRRKRISLTLDSTFRMMSLKRLQVAG